VRRGAKGGGGDEGEEGEEGDSPVIIISSLSFLLF
jgi:hypothetical protein